jgi:DNA end-binding protein Ku
MQTIWKGTVSFGLVSIPVRLYAATEERDVSFRQVHVEDGGRIRYKRVCEKDGAEVAYKDIAKGYELPDGQMVVLTSEDFASLPLPSRKTIDVLQFVPGESIDPVYFAKTYYLQAEGPGSKPYVLLRDALLNADRVAVVKVALRNRESLATLRPKGDVLVLQTMLWPDEVRDESFAAPAEDVDVRPQEIAMAESYIDTLAEDFNPEAFSDDYRGALEELIAAKVGDREVTEPDEPQETGGNVVDLMAALKASVEAAKKRRAGETAESSESSEDEDEATGTEGRTARKSTARTAKKATGGTAKKTASKSTATKKAPAKKTASTAKKATGTAKKATGTSRSGTSKSAASTSSASKAPAKKTTTRRKSA